MDIGIGACHRLIVTMVTCISNEMHTHQIMQGQERKLLLYTISAVYSILSYCMYSLTLTHHCKSIFRSMDAFDLTVGPPFHHLHDQMIKCTSLLYFQVFFHSCSTPNSNRQCAHTACNKSKLSEAFKCLVGRC